MRKKLSLTALILAVVLLAGCAADVVEAPELIEPVGVQSDMAEAYIGEIYNMACYEASVVPYVENLYFEVDGSVANVLIHPGKWVEEGDILVELDQTSLKERAEQLEKELEYAERTNAYSDAMVGLDIELLKVELEQLNAQGADDTAIALKENEIAQKEAALRQAASLREPDLEKMREELADIEVKLENNVLRAPFSGRIAFQDELVEGMWVQAFEPIVFLADDSQLMVNSDYVTDSVFARAHRVYAHIGADEYDITARPIDKDEYVTAILSGMTVNTVYDINGPEDKLDLIEAGDYAVVIVISNYQSDVLLVPSGAVYRDAGGRYVYVDEDGERVRRQVKVGMSTDALTSITEGLEEGEVVYVKD